MRWRDDQGIGHEHNWQFQARASRFERGRCFASVDRNAPGALLRSIDDLGDEDRRTRDHASLCSRLDDVNGRGKTFRVIASVKCMAIQLDCRRSARATSPCRRQRRGPSTVSASALVPADDVQPTAVVHASPRASIAGRVLTPSAATPARSIPERTQRSRAALPHRVMCAHGGPICGTRARLGEIPMRRASGRRRVANLTTTLLLDIAFCVVSEFDRAISNHSNAPGIVGTVRNIPSPRDGTTDRAKESRSRRWK